MGKATGFLEYERKNNYDIPPAERIRNFNEFHTPLTDEERREQGARCMNCGVPFCQSAMTLAGMVTGCPLHNLIPEWNEQVYIGNAKHAAERLQKTNNFPEFTGRVCPALCEKACINGEYGEPVTVHDNELFIIERAYESGQMQPMPPAVRSGKRVAVVGSGPSGLAVADVLNKRGHAVTVYEREDRIGGLLMYGIPNMKLDKRVIARRQKLMEAEGVTFLVGTDIGRDVSAKELLKQYEAIVLCCGAKQPRALAGVEPEKTKGVYYAVDFLTSTTKSLLKHGERDTEAFAKSRDYISARDKDVIIVGGGDTGNDCIGTSIRHGAKSVTAIEMMPQPPKERSESNPWPQWPKVLKTDYGHEEAIECFGSDPRIFGTTIKEVKTNKSGAIRSVVTVKVQFENGKLTQVEGSERELPCQLLLIAAGFTGCEPYTAKDFGVKLGERGTVQTDDYRTCTDKVFSAGDMRRGQSLVVWAIAEGRECARQVDEFLMGYSNLP